MASRKQVSAAKRNIGKAAARAQLFERAKERNIEGRSKMGKRELIDALRA